MRAVDGLKVYRQPRAFTVWMQSRLRDSKAGRDSDPGDLVSILAPATDEGDSNKIGYGAVNGFQDTEDDSVADFDVLLIIEEPEEGDELERLFDDAMSQAETR
ncbi:hypothetical protein BM221_009558 [Beauveria bassiana]|uniref:Uncharacterized protein n=1 Tax=Beauveria bassiana TaxID=176275 RepID=A0A2N6NBS5_BEABA|nr:hypothetical protein BM221_009558 [Beauveria bassiana]